MRSSRMPNSLHGKESVYNSLEVRRMSASLENEVTRLSHILVTQLIYMWRRQEDLADFNSGVDIQAMLNNRNA